MDSDGFLWRSLRMNSQTQGRQTCWWSRWTPCRSLSSRSGSELNLIRSWPELETVCKKAGQMWTRWRKSTLLRQKDWTYCAGWLHTVGLATTSSKTFSQESPWQPSWSQLNEEFGSAIFMVAKDELWNRISCKTLQHMPDTQDYAQQRAIAPVGMAQSTMEPTAPGLCWSIYGEDVCSWGGCTFKMVECVSYGHLHVYSYRRETATVVCSSWVTRNSSDKQWYLFHQT